MPMRWIEQELRHSDTPFRLIEAIGFARVPILKLEHKASGTDVDLAFNNVLGVHNSALLRVYVTADPSGRPAMLVAAVKAWAKAAGVKDSSVNTLSSYGWTLLVIFFLQRRGVLPCLQAPGLLAAYERWRGTPLPTVNANGFDLRYCADEAFVSALTKARIDTGQYCHEAASSLLIGFFDYYTRVFDWTRFAVSVRLGEPRPRGDWPAGFRGRIGIEDPFENERDLCVTIGREGKLPGQLKIFKAMVEARETLLARVKPGDSHAAARAAFEALLSSA